MAAPSSEERRRRAAFAGAAAGTGAFDAVRALTPAAAGIVALPTEPAKAATKVAILAWLNGFLNRLADADRVALTKTLGPLARVPSDVEQAIADEEEFGAEFAARSRARVEAGLNLALRITDPTRRAQAVRAVLAAEQRYLRARQAAMFARSSAAIERFRLRHESPWGAFWRIGVAKDHTAGCLFMNDRPWPWSVLDRVHPPRHYGCTSRLYSIGTAIERGWMPPGLPRVSDAVRSAADVVMEAEEAFEAAREQETLEALAVLVEREEISPAALAVALYPIVEGVWEEVKHPRDVVGRFARKLDEAQPTKAVQLDAETRVKEDAAGYRVVRNNRIVKFSNKHDAIRHALEVSAKSGHPESIGGKSFKSYDEYLRSRGVDPTDPVDLTGKPLDRAAIAEEVGRLQQEEIAAGKSEDRYVKRGARTLKLRRANLVEKSKSDGPAPPPRPEPKPEPKPPTPDLPKAEVNPPILRGPKNETRDLIEERHGPYLRQLWKSAGEAAEADRAAAEARLSPNARSLPDGTIVKVEVGDPEKKDHVSVTFLTGRRAGEFQAVFPSKDLGPVDETMTKAIGLIGQKSQEDRFRSAVADRPDLLSNLGRTIQFGAAQHQTTVFARLVKKKDDAHRAFVSVDERLRTVRSLRNSIVPREDPEEYRRLSDEVEKARKAHLKAWAATKDAEAEFRARDGEAAREALREVRDGFGDGKFEGRKPTGKLAGRLTDAATRLPREWIDGHDAPALKATRGRAYYRHRDYDSRRGSISRIVSDESAPTMLHELGHWAEHRNEAVARASAAFHKNRTAGEEPVSLRKLLPRHGYRSDERSQPDGFADPYVGKLYSSPSSWETVTMGLEGVFYGQHRIRENDPDHARWTLGVLAIL